MKIMNREEFDRANVFGIGAPNDGYARYFQGQSYLNIVTDPKAAGMTVMNVTFEPGCRNNWHIHKATSGGGQLLLCVAGEGWYQQESKDPVGLVPGKVVLIPAGVKHWHGAKKDSWFSHIALELPGVDGSVEWCEPVSDEEYANLRDL